MKIIVEFHDEAKFHYELNPDDENYPIQVSDDPYEENCSLEGCGNLVGQTLVEDEDSYGRPSAGYNFNCYLSIINPENKEGALYFCEDCTILLESAFLNKYPKIIQVERIENA